MSGSSQPIADLSPEEKRALLAKLLREKAKEPQSYPPSFAQEWLWFFDQLEPGHPAYNIPSAARIKGSFDLAVAQQVVNEIVRRHAVLRTTFPTVNGKPVQIIAPSLTLPISVMDLQGVSDSQREEEVSRLTVEEARRPFDLAQGPLLRVTFLVLGEKEHILLVTMHHIISDGWSGAVFVREALALYGAFSRGAPSPLPELPLQYADYAIGQRQCLKGEVLDAQLAYWKRQLDRLPLLELPTDRPRPAVQSYRGTRQALVLPKALTATLKELSRREGVTLFMTLLAAFKVLLSRYTGQYDIAVGSPIAGRNRAEVEGLIGLFVNFLILRTSLRGDLTFRELLRRVREVCQGAYAHQDLPVEKLAEILRPKRGKHQAPLFQVALDFEPLTMRPLELGGLSISPLQVDTGTANIDLGLTVRESEETLTGFLEYSTDLFDASTMTRMLEHYVALLEDVVANPEQRLLSLRCLDEAERRQLWLKRYKLRRKGLLDSLNDVEQLSNLTKNQLLLWVGQQLQPDVPLYNLAASLTIWGEVDREAFKKAFQTLINSSDALRTVIQQRDGVPEQRAITDLQYRLEYLDFSHLSDPDAELRVWMGKRCQVRFDFEKCLFDSVLIKLSDKKFVWYLNQHHIITDGWSVWLIFNRMAELYERSLEGRLEERVELRSFQDYVDDEREYRSSSRYVRDEAYWKEKLAKELEPIAFYGKTPLKQLTRVQRISYDLGLERTRKLRVLAAQQGISAGTVDASLFNIFAATLCTYLCRISRNTGISFGTPIHNRRSRAFEETIGSFVEVLPIHVKIEGGDTFFTLIKKLKVEMFETLRHGRYSISNPLQRKAYDVVLNYHHMSNVTHRDYNGASVETEVIHTGHGNESLGLRIVDFGDSGSFTLDFDFHRDVFDDELQGQAIQHFLRVLDAFLENPAQLLNQVSLLTAEEKQRILVEFNETEVPLPENQTIHQLFEAQVERTPDNVAVVFDEQRLTYRELNRAANQVAHHLQALGVGPEVLVAICIEHSVEMVIGLLGILKAGGAYVPLDPVYPKERMAFMLQDSQARVLLTQERMIAELIGGRRSHVEGGGSRFSILDSQIDVVCLDTDWEGIARESQADPDSRLTADNLAYVIYTSGSTGKPKGVLISHGSIVNHCRCIQRHYELDSSDQVLQFASPSFDASLEQILTALIAGAKLVLRGTDVWAATDFHKKILDFGLTVVNLPTAYWQQLVREWSNAPLLVPDNQLKLVVVGGDLMPPEGLNLWQQTAMHSVRLLNAYGPTETTITATIFEIPPGFSRDMPLKRIPIGRPLACRAIYILDKPGSLVPIGVPGELHIGGVGVARGYLNRPDLTAEKFIPNPFSEEPGARLYRTGDLARYLPDGNIEFLGRVDHQVKIRGFRIELGEIEAVLGQHPAVREAVVLAREDVPGDPSALLRTGKRLVAYVVPLDQEAVSVSEFRSFLREKLPEYMVPSAFMLLDELPLTPNGKIDRRVLPAPDQARPELEKPFVAPRTPTEEVLAGIWAKALRIEQVGVYDNFFELGGDSILSIQIVAKANQAGLRLSPRQLFERQTIAELATVIGTVRAIEAEQGLVTGLVPLTPIQRWFFKQDLPEPHHFTKTLLFEIRQALNPSWLKRAIHELLMHHDALRLRFVREETGWQQVNAGPEERVPFTQLDLSALPAAEQKDAVDRAAAELQASFNLSDGPMMRLVLFESGAGKPSQLLINVHHLAVDAISWRILLEDLLMAYLQLNRGEVIQLPPKTTSFKQWAERLTQYAESGALQQELDYWLAESRTRVSRLPVDYPGGANTLASAETVRVSLTAEETQALLQDVPQAHHNQINDVLLTALVQAFTAWTGESFLLVDLEGHGREEVFEDLDLSRTVGWFTTIFPVLLDLGAASNPGEALNMVKDQLRCIPNRGIGYGLLRYIKQDTAITEKLRLLPQSEVRFNYLGQFDQLVPEPAIFGLPRDVSEPSRSQRGSRSYLLDVNGGVAGAQLHMAWTYSENLHRRSTIEALAQDFVAALRLLITQCKGRGAVAYTPSEFPKTKFSLKEFEARIASVDASSRE